MAAPKCLMFFSRIFPGTAPNVERRPSGNLGKFLAVARPRSGMNTLIRNCCHVSMIDEDPRSCVYGIGDRLIALARAAVCISSIIDRKAPTYDPHHRYTQQT